MAPVNPVSYHPSSYAADSADAASGTSAMGKDAFFKLLIAQLQNQNPLNPMDGTEFTAQLAQFSQLEQLSDMNTNMEFVQLYLASLNNAQAVEFIGKEIEARGNTVQLKEGNSVPIGYELPQDAASVTITISDQNGLVVRTEQIGAQYEGGQVWDWDGKDNQEKEMVEGTYTFGVSATTANGEEINVSTHVLGVITGVTFEDGINYLMLEEQKVPIGDVIRVRGQDVPAEQEPESKTAEILKGIGAFLKNAAPIAAMAL